jgi:hypothetical protein
MVWLGGRIGERPDKLDYGWGIKLGGVPPNNLNLEALKFWQRFVLSNHSQKLFQNM